MAEQTTREAGILAPAYRTATVGSFALIFLAAFEALAVTTIMPTVAEELDGDALYSLAFSGTLAASVVGMVAGGAWSDRRGPVPPLLAAVGVFLTGLLAAGLATDMGVFVVGRFLQGLGGGATTVALYVVVARLYPARLHPSIFGAFAAAWVIPSLIGPAVAGFVADEISWHWVFLGVGVLTLAASAVMLPTLRLLLATPHERAEELARAWPAILLSLVVAAGVVAISIGGELGGGAAHGDAGAGSPGTGWLGWAVAAAALVVVAVAMRPLLPKRTLLVGRGLPATVMLRGAVAAAFFATEIYLPLLLQERDGLSATAAGLILTVGAVSWAVGSDVQGRFLARMPHDVVVRIGAALVAAGIAGQLLVAVLGLGPVGAAAAWLVAGAGMGTVFPRISTLVLAYSTPRDQGFNSSAMSMADAVGGAIAIALSGLVFAAVGGREQPSAFTAVFVLTALLAVLAVPVAIRVRERAREASGHATAAS
ncbi:MFS transporter [Homoserinibacter sp. YIM 151385]|uniref:MFS transporter n=1 Tax=Homoserinibacter sp. YIM 151385 TaxID=2985506 RepID=UPI0022F10D8F|nr:MFS transporter [Homoserinibacter sp. YIM 151385]WBU39100.1 MFS transporter [Homoserinibacter sp. YIM 151385]